MKKHKSIIAAITFSVLIVVSFFVGSYTKEQECINRRKQQCETFISFAINNIENRDLSDPGVMKALISDVYAAYGFCDDSVLAGQLHDLWNALIFESDSYNNLNDTALKKLNDILQTLKISQGLFKDTVCARV